MNDPQHPPNLFTVDPTFGYFPSGALRKATYGNGLMESSVLNNRLQPCRYNVNWSRMALSVCTTAIPANNLQDFNYGFNAGTTDNGNVASMNAAGAQTFNRTYTYESLNRLSTLSSPSDPSGCNGLSWGYDPWGNRTAQTTTSGSCFQQPSTTFTTSNQFPTSYQYDAAGNMTYDGMHQYAYDAENRLIQVDGSAGYCSTRSGTPATACYVYDAMGRRVHKSGTGVPYPIDVIYDLDGHVTAEYEPACSGGTECWSTGYAYVNGALVAEYKNATTYFIHHDQLGSTRLVSIYPAPSNPTLPSQWLSETLDYLPFGELNSTDTGIDSHKFTSKERDMETASPPGASNGLDNFDFRYNSSSLGRFTSPDPLGGSISNPQSLNRYAYVLNNPLNFVDPFGLEADAQQGCVVSVIDSNGNNWGGNCPGTSSGVGSLPTGNAADLVPLTPSPSAPSGDALPEQATTTLPSSNPGAGSGINPGLDATQLGLGALGMIPGPIGTGASLINAGISIYRGNYGDAALNAAFAIPFVGTFGRAAKFGEEALEASKGIEGIYEFVGNSGRIYVGQSGNIGLRLAQHLNSGALLNEGISSVRFTEITGGRLAREIAEQTRIEELGGVGNLQNVRNAIGPARDYLMVPFRK
jgi:RHS repeat-associated protein